MHRLIAIINKNLQAAGSLHDDTRAFSHTVHAAWALNLLGVDQDLFNSADGDALLDLIDKYLDDSGGIAPPFNPAR